MIVSRGLWLVCHYNVYGLYERDEVTQHEAVKMVWKYFLYLPRKLYVFASVHQMRKIDACVVILSNFNSSCMYTLLMAYHASSKGKLNYWTCLYFRENWFCLRNSNNNSNEGELRERFLKKKHSFGY